MGLRENMAAFLRAFMEQNNKSLAKMQEDVEISRNTLYSYVRGDGNPTFSTVEYIAERLDVAPTDITSGIYDPGSRELPADILYTLRCVADLPEDRRQRFIDLFLELVELLDKT